MKYLITMLMVLIIPNIAIADDDEDTIFQNCIIKETPKDATSYVKEQVFLKCLRISKNPARWQKWKYSD